MKRFDIITEADARTIEIGETVTLAKGGHVTPLASDTLKARRVTVVSDRMSAVDEGLAPPAEVRRIAIGSDHTGVALKAALVAHLRGQGRQVDDLGVHSGELAGRVARAVSRGEAEGGIAIDGAGIGSAIAANKVRGVRAAMCPDVRIARYSREHNGANVLTLGATLVTEADARAIVDAWLATAMREPRYIRRLALIAGLEREQE
jgi:ribose 5-phosphate isomerase B